MQTGDQILKKILKALEHNYLTFFLLEDLDIL